MPSKYLQSLNYYFLLDKYRDNPNNRNQIVVMFSRIEMYGHNIIYMSNYVSTERRTYEMSLPPPVDEVFYTLLPLESIKFS